MGLRIERDQEMGAITGVEVTPELPDALSPDEALLTVVLDPSEENLEAGARHADSRVRWAIALHPRLTAEVAMTLAHDASGDVQRALASNPATPEGVLDELGQAENLAVANAALRTLVEKLREETKGR